jgi:hypothetical protein
LIVQLSAAENLSLPSLDRLDHFGLLARDKERWLVDGLITKLSIRLRSPRQTLLRLSGGNQQKVAIAKWLPLTPEIYLLAEPTRGIDVGTKQEIYRLMRELTAAGASILLISSDTIELLGLCDRVLVMYERRPVAILAGAEVTEQNVVHASVAGHGNGRSSRTWMNRTVFIARSELGSPNAPGPSPQERGYRAGPKTRTISSDFSAVCRGPGKMWRRCYALWTLVFALHLPNLTRESISLSTNYHMSASPLPHFLVAWLSRS